MISKKEIMLRIIDMEDELDCLTNDVIKMKNKLAKITSKKVKNETKK